MGEVHACVDNKGLRSVASAAAASAALSRDLAVDHSVLAARACPHCSVSVTRPYLSRL